VVRWPLAADVGIGRDVGDDAIHCQASCLLTPPPGAARTVTGREGGGFNSNPDNHATYVVRRIGLARTEYVYVRTGIGNGIRSSTANHTGYQAYPLRTCVHLDWS
jgi:hypothetical protein